MSDFPFASLEILGWNPFFESHRHCLTPDHVPARVACEQRGRYELLTQRGPVHAALGGRLRHHAVSRLDLPAVGDWVAARLAAGGAEAVVDLVLPRATHFTRKAAGTRVEPQVVAANIDTVVVVTSANHDFNPRRLERYLAVVDASGALPLVLLNKADLCPDPCRYTEALAAVAPRVPVLVTSALAGEGVDVLRARIRTGLTFAFVGSSGVGKSTLLNALMGSSLPTGPVREHDDRGRHVTTSRELFLLPEGGLVVDTPGMRELQGWLAEDGLAAAFEDVESLGRACRFGDCRHAAEPGCEVRRALEDGRLDAARLASYGKLQREMAHEARRTDPLAMRAARREWKLRGAHAKLKLRNR